VSVIGNHSVHSAARGLATLLAAAAVLAGPWASAGAANIGTSFTYQGSLSDGVSPATGLYDFRFTLYDASSGGTGFGPVDANDLQVVNGVFTSELDFGANVWGPSKMMWIEVQVRPGASTGAYTVLPRQKLTPAPYAMNLSLPHYQGVADVGTVLTIENTSSGDGAHFSGGATGNLLSYGLVGTSGSSASQAAGVLGIANGTSGLTIGTKGQALASPTGTGLVGVGTASGAYVEATNNNSSSTGLTAVNSGAGTAIYAVGKGATRTAATLRVVNNEPNSGMAAYLTNNSGYATAHFQNGGAGQILWLEQTGTGHFIQAVSPTGTKFWVDAAGTTHTKVLEILGGADLSEKFDVGAASVEPGTVVSIDPSREGRLIVSRDSYDHRVAGIVSGAGGVKTGMLMGQSGTVASGEHAIALTGRVYCRASAVNGPIRPGDLLTTSTIPGHAMRVSDPSRGQGAVLGKAMGSLERGEGLVLVLVGLQ
jgi:hypothetical protein